ncbi:hypothetical protein ACFQE8_00620 [Salinirubellus sp. GCM10025818]|uniref:hypothetical protein n=1 Tax=Salinirubellus TaxID=2162630 RepID=UPI0030D5BB71
MPIGSLSTGAILGAIATLTGAGIPLFYRYVWGSKSHVSLSRLTTTEDSEWRDGRNNNLPVWSRRILVRASNSGWRDGVISQVTLDEVVLSGKSGHTIISAPEDSVHKIKLEHYSEAGENTHLTLQQRTSYRGQIVGGRSDELMGIIPFILQESELGEEMKEAKKGLFKFSFTVEDNKRVYYTSVNVSTSLEDSTGGKLSPSI